jgi:hypothetical protein
MDSRVSAFYLAGLGLDATRIRLFTFASSLSSYEVRFGAEVAGVLGYSLPDVFLLRDSHYAHALDYLPVWTAGQIGNNHCHIAEYLSQHAGSFSRNTRHVSTYYSDALFGWECTGIRGDLTVNASVTYKKVQDYPDIPADIREQILNDIQLSLKDAEAARGLSDVTEYRYLTERHGKFHMPLAFVQSQFVPTSSPFADFDLLSYVLSIPLQLRKRKRILDELLRLKAPALATIGNSSSREYFYGANSMMVRRGLQGRLRFLQFRLLNAVNGVANHLTAGRVQLSNPFQTEELGGLYKRHYEALLAAAAEESRLSEYLPPQVLRTILQPRLRERYLAEKFQILNIISLRLPRTAAIHQEGRL